MIVERILLDVERKIVILLCCEIRVCAALIDPVGNKRMTWVSAEQTKSVSEEKCNRERGICFC